ncbi:hypothetical protein B0H11DRAFT_1928632 [Mycena galericulata]|nr:hypothetical protein B0H11DRAFT_1928632 [Mycena galericulata]
MNPSEGEKPTPIGAIQTIHRRNPHRKEGQLEGKATYIFSAANLVYASEPLHDGAKHIRGTQERRTQYKKGFSSGKIPPLMKPENDIEIFDGGDADQGDDLGCGLCDEADLIIASRELGAAAPLSESSAATVEASAGAETDSDSTPDIKKTMPKLAALFSNPAIFYIVIFSGDTRAVSLDKPLLENVGSALAFLCRGLTVVVVAYLLLGVVAWSSRVVVRGPRDVEAPDSSADKDMRAAEAHNLDEKAEKALILLRHPLCLMLRLIHHILLDEHHPTSTTALHTFANRI